VGKLFKRWSEEGIRFPYAYSGDEKKPSVTLLFVWLTGMLALGSTLALNFVDTLQAALTSIIFWVLSMVFYRLRRIDKLKIDLDDRQLEIEGEGSEADK
jgi:hypothetical protein